MGENTQAVPSVKRKPLKGCPLSFEVTAKDCSLAEEIRDNGGNLTAAEIAHSRQFERNAMAWTAPRARRWITSEQRGGRWLNAHAHTDGTIHVPRRGE